MWRFEKYSDSGLRTEHTDYIGEVFKNNPSQRKEYERVIAHNKRNNSDVDNYFLILPLIWAAMFSLWVWYISMWVVMAMALAFTMRMARRGQKLLTKHIKDPDAHKVSD